MEELKRACRALREDSMDFALLTSPENVVYVSGFDVPVPIGAPVDFAGGFPLALVLVNAKEEAAQLIVADTYGELAASKSWLSEPLIFPIFNHFSPLDAVSSYVDCVRKAMNDEGLAHSHAQIGIEFETLPSILLNLITCEFESVCISNAKSSLEKARRIKTTREIQLLRRSAQVADDGQQVLLDLASSGGITEFEIWAKVGQRIMEEAGKVVPIVGELVTGERTNVVTYPGGPVSRSVSLGDTGLMDISVRVDGYWADCANVVVFGGEPNKEQRRYFKAAKDAFEAAVDEMRPGVRCCDVEASVRRAFERNGFSVTHYSGHQIGATVNENPRIVPFDTSIVEAGMVFCFEPGVYAGRGGSTGARLERVVLVTDSGAEVLNQFPWGIK